MNISLSIRPCEPLVTDHGDGISVHGYQSLQLPNDQMIMSDAGLRLSYAQAYSLVEKLTAMLEAVTMRGESR